MSTVRFPPTGSPADSGYVPPPGDQVNFPTYARPAPDIQPPVIFPPTGSPADSGYVPPPGDDVLFPAWTYQPALRPPVVFPPPGSPVDHPYTPPPGDDVVFPRWPPFTASVLPRKYPAGWSAGIRQQQPTQVTWGAADIIDRAGQSAPWSAAQPTRHVHSAPWLAAQSINGGGYAPRWRDSIQRRSRTVSPWPAATSIDRAGIVAPWGLASTCNTVIPAPWNATLIIDGPRLVAPWSAATQTILPTPAIWSAATLCDAVIPAPFGVATLRDRLDIPIPIVWPIEPDPIYEIPDRGAYIVSYDAIIVTLPDGNELDVGPITIQLDLARWAIALSTVCLDQASYDRIRPRAGDAVVIQVTVQGYVLQFLVDVPEEKSEFDADDWSLTATSLTIQQGAPYARPRDLRASTLATAQQHALNELPLIDWSLQWDAPDWPVAAGAWSYQGLTPVQAISRLAAAAGGALQSDLSGQGLRVLPVYPVMPWDLPDATPDYSIPLGSCITTTRSPALLGTRPNAVYVQGGDAGGLLGHVVRNGTAGDIEMATVVNPLMTDAVALRALGGKLLADQYQPPELHTITLPLGDAASDHPMVELGKIIALTNGPSELLAIATALTIQITPPGLGQGEGPEITQTVTLHGRATNPYSRLQALSPQPPLLVGTVVTVTGNDVVVQLLGGGLVTARGSAGVGDTVYVRAGVVEGPAPALVAVEIAV